MAAFIIFIVAMGIKMASSSEALYEKDYYEQGEQHAERMELEKVGKAVEVNYRISERGFSVLFDSIGFVNEIKLVHMAGAEDDRIVRPKDLEPSAAKLIDVETLKPGVWMMEVKGEVNSKSFFIKKQFVI